MCCGQSDSPPGSLDGRGGFFRLNIVLMLEPSGCGRVLPTMQATTTCQDCGTETRMPHSVVSEPVAKWVYNPRDGEYCTECAVRRVSSGDGEGYRDGDVWVDANGRRWKERI